MISLCSNAGVSKLGCVAEITGGLWKTADSQGLIPDLQIWFPGQDPKKLYLNWAPTENLRWVSQHLSWDRHLVPVWNGFPFGIQCVWGKWNDENRRHACIYELLNNDWGVGFQSPCRTVISLRLWAQGYSLLNPNTWSPSWHTWTLHTDLLNTDTLWTASCQWPWLL